jgi:branched-chain amino acid transport system substrate-binding protein
LRNLTALLFCLCCALPSHAEILIGVAGPFSGQNASYGNELRVGAAAAISEINAKGGINGESLMIVEGDDGCDAKRAVEVAKSFQSKDVRAVIGHFCTSASIAAAPTYLNAGILMINPSVTAPGLTSKNLWNVFRLTGREDTQGTFAAARMKAEGLAADVFLITDGEAETALINQQFVAALPNAKVMTVKAGDPRLPDEPGLILASAVYLSLQANDAAIVAKQLRELNTNAPFFGPDFLQSESFRNRGGPAAEGTTISFLQDSMSIANPTRALALPSNEGATLAAYSAIEIFVAAAKARGVNEARGMSAWLAAGNEISTILGPLRFNSSGDLQNQPYVWYRWSGDNLEIEQ